MHINFILHKVKFNYILFNYISAISRTNQISLIWQRWSRTDRSIEYGGSRVGQNRSVEYGGGGVGQTRSVEYGSGRAGRNRSDEYGGDEVEQTRSGE